MEQVWLDESFIELHFANIMVAAKFIIEKGNNNSEEATGSGMTLVLKTLSGMAIQYMKQR